MIWPICEVECLTDDEFAKDLEPTKREIKFFCSTIFYMTSLPSVFLLILKNDSIWEDFCFEYEYLDAMRFLSNMSYYREIDVEKFKEVLEKKSLKITNVEQIK